MQSARDEAFELVGDAGPAFAVTDVTHNFSALIERKVSGRFEAPLFLNSKQPSRSARLHRGDDGRPTSAGRVANYTFEVLVPRTVLEAGAGAAAVLQYGHGLFGSKKEMESSYLQQIASDRRYILVAVDWIGMAQVDAAFVGLMMATDFSDFAIVPDRSVQGMVNALLMPRLVAGGLGAHPALAAADGGSLVSADPERRYYFGNSQGGILGSVYMALSADVKRGVLGVPGGPYSLLLPRSADFKQLGAIIKARYGSHPERVALLSMMQLLWARAEPAGFTDAISSAPLGTSAHRVLLHYGLGDAQVTWLGAQTLARSIGGAKVYASNVHTHSTEGDADHEEVLFGLGIVPDDAVEKESSMIVGFDFGVPAANIPSFDVSASKETDTHECPRRDPAAIAMLTHFLEQGEIVNTCGGACVRPRSC